MWTLWQRCLGGRRRFPPSVGPDAHDGGGWLRTRRLVVEFCQRLDLGGPLAIPFAALTFGRQYSESGGGGGPDAQGTWRRIDPESPDIHDGVGGGQKTAHPGHATAGGSGFGGGDGL